jgi:hypothetical protein
VSDRDWRMAFLAIAAKVVDGMPTPRQVRDNGDGLLCLDLATHDDLREWARWFEIAPARASRHRTTLVLTAYGQWRGWTVQLLAVSEVDDSAALLAAAMPTGVEGYSISGRDAFVSGPTVLEYRP